MDDVEPTKEKLEATSLDDADEEEEELTRRDPWAQVEETKHKQAETQTAMTMPGGFD